MQILDSIGQFLLMVGGIIGNLLMGITELVQMIPQALTFLAYGITSLPPVLTVFATAFISISVVYLVIGR